MPLKATFFFHTQVVQLYYGACGLKKRCLRRGFFFFTNTSLQRVTGLIGPQDNSTGGQPFFHVPMLDRASKPTKRDNWGPSLFFFLQKGHPNL